LYDKDTRLVRFGVRDYDPITGKWTAKDPILFKGGDTNLFGYVGNNAVNKKDPKGLNWHGNWCGPGGSGPVTDCADVACKKHDQCYKDCGVNWLTRWIPGFDLQGSSCAWVCDEELMKGWKKCACSDGASGRW
jgi:RHS repeat-associated protein